MIKINGKTHLVAGAMITIVPALGLENGLIFIGGVLGSILPDVDSNKSIINSKVPALKFLFDTCEFITCIFSKRSKKLFVHRGKLLHSFYTIMFFIIISFIFKSMLAIGLTIGIASHHALDMMTKQGLKEYF